MTDPMSPRKYLLPDRFRENPVWEEFANALDEVLTEQVDNPSLMFLDLRNVRRDSSRYILQHTAELLGVEKQASYMNDERMRKLLTHLPAFREENSSEAWKSFLGFLVNRQLGVDYLWTEDYFAFFSVRYGDPLISDLGERREDNAGWYNTTHVLMRANARAIFPDSQNPYQDLMDLFNTVAPAYLVLEFIGNILPPYEAELRFNLGVVDGFATDTYTFNYELPNLSTADWKQARDLPFSLTYHGLSNLSEGKILSTGGFSGDRRNEKTTFIVSQYSGPFQRFEMPFNDSITTAMAYAPNLTTVMAGSSTGELALSFDAGRTWKKVWSPYFSNKIPIVGLVYAPEYGLFMACGLDGTTVLAQDPENWNNVPVKLPEQVNTLLFNVGVYVALCNGMKIYWSLDGKTWTRQQVTNTGLNDNLYCGTFDPQLNQWFLAGSCGRVFLSVNLLNWVEVNTGFGDYAIRSCAFSEKRQLYVIGGDNASLAASSDARTWFLRDAYFRTEDVARVYYLPGHDLFCAFGAKGTYAASQDVYNWNLYVNPLVTAGGTGVQVANCMVYIKEGGHTVFGANGGYSYTSVLNEKFIKGPDLPERSAHHTQIDLQDGTALVIGGQTNETLFDTTLLYDPEASDWVSRAAYPTEIRQAAGYLIPSREVGQIWTPRNPKFGSFSVNTLQYLDYLDCYVAAGQQNRASQSQYAINWQRIEDPFSAQHPVAAQYSSDGSLVVCANNVPTPNIVFTGANIREQQLNWKQAFLDLSGADARDFKYIRSGDVQLMLIAKFDDSTTATETYSDASGNTVTKANYVPVVQTGAGLSFTQLSLPSRPTNLQRAIFCGTYIEQLNLYLLGTIGGVYRSTDGVNFEFVAVDPEEATSYSAELPVIAVAYGPTGIVAVQAQGVFYLSLSAGKYWQTTTGNSLNLYSAEGSLDFDYAAWAEDPEAASLLVNVDLRWNPNARLWECIANFDAGGDHIWTRFDPMMTTAEGVFLDASAYTRDPMPRRFFNLYSALSPLWALYSGNPWDQDDEILVNLDARGVYVANYTNNPVYGLNQDVDTTLYPFNSFPTDAQHSEAGLLCIESVRQFTSGVLTNTIFLGGGSWLWRIAGQGDANNATRRVPVQLQAIPNANIGWTYVAGDLPEMSARYAVTVYDDYGDSAPVFVDVNVPDSTEGVGISLTWLAVPGARGYRVWGRQGAALKLLADLPPNDTNFVDDGTLVPDATKPIPNTNTSGLSLFENEGGAGTGLEIIDIKHVESLGVTVLATRTGRLAYSYDLQSWFGVNNPAVQLLAQRIIVRETHSFWCTAATGGNLAISKEWGSSADVITDPTLGDLTSIHYDANTNTAVVAGKSQKLQVSHHELEVAAGVDFNQTADSTVEEFGFTFGDFYLVLQLCDANGEAIGRAGPGIGYAAGSHIRLNYWVDYPDSRLDHFRVFLYEGLDLTAAPYYLGRIVVNFDSTSQYRLFDRTISSDLVWCEDLTDLTIDTSEVAGDRIAIIDIATETRDDGLWVVVQVDGQPFSEARVADGGDVGEVLGVGYTVGGEGAWTLYLQSIEQATGIQPFLVENNSYHEIGQYWKTIDTELTGFNANHVSMYESTSGDRRWLVVGDSGFMAWSSDPEAEWLPLTLHLPATGSTNLTCASHAIIGGQQVSVIGGEDKLLGVTNNLFSQQLSIINGTGFASHVRDVRYVPGDRLFLGVGDDSSMCVSTDGRSWVTLSVAYVTNFKKISFGTAQYAVTVVGDYGTLLTGSSVQTLLKRPNPMGSGNITTVLASASASTVLMAGQGQSITVSDGLSGPWTELTLSNDNSYEDTGIETTPLNGISCGVVINANDTQVLFGDNGYVYTLNAWADPTHRTQGVIAVPLLATDGLYSRYVDITCCAIDQATRTVLVGMANGTIMRWDTNALRFVATSPTGFAVVNGITFGAGVWVAVSNDGKIVRSSNAGKTWSKTTVTFLPYTFRRPTLDTADVGDQRIDFMSVTFGDGIFLAVGDEGDVCTSENAGVTWILRDSRMNGTKGNTTAYGGNTYLVGGDAGTVRTTFTGFDEAIMVCGGATTYNGASVASTNLYDRTGNSWSSAGDMLIARRNHGAAGFEDGTVMVMGGVDADDLPLASTERWLPHRGVWAADLDMPYAKGYARAQTSTEGAVIVTGSGPNPYNSALVYLPASVAPAPPLLTKGVGFLAAGDYWYRLSVSTVHGETLPTRPLRITLTETSGVILDWERVDNAVEYRIYGRTAAADELLAIIPGHLTSYNDLGVAAVSSGTIARVDGSADSWFEIDGELPLPREGHGFCKLNSEFMYSCGGYADWRAWRLLVNPYNFVMAASVATGNDPASNYVVPGYVDNGSASSQDDNYVTPNQ